MTHCGDISRHTGGCCLSVLLLDERAACGGRLRLPVRSMATSAAPRGSGWYGYRHSSAHGPPGPTTSTAVRLWPPSVRSNRVAIVAEAAPHLIIMPLLWPRIRFGCKTIK